MLIFLKLWNNLEYILMNSVILYHKDIIVILKSIYVKNTHLLLHIHILVLLINKTNILCYMITTEMFEIYHILLNS
jgi:hypothetical protein